MIQRITLSRHYKWWIFWTIATGTFFSVIDHGSVLIALPGIESHFDATLESVQWVVVAYALTISVLLLPMGRLGDVVGRRKVYVAGTAIFVLGSLGSTFAPDLSILIACRVLQGVGSGMVQGCGMGMFIAAFPDSERGKALGMHLSMVGLGAIAGPALGGFLVAWLGWQWVFFVNVPTGTIVFALSWLLLERGPNSVRDRQGERGAFDWIGAGLSGVILLVMLLVVGNGNALGWLSVLAIVGGVSVVVLSAAFVWWELRTKSPMLELRLFANRIFGLGVAAAWLSFFGTSAARFMMPFYLQRVLSYSPEQVGLMMIPAALCMVVIGPFSGRLSDRFGWQAFTIGGISLTAAGRLCFRLFPYRTVTRWTDNRHYDAAKLGHRIVQLSQQQQHHKCGGAKQVRSGFGLDTTGTQLSQRRQRRRGDHRGCVNHGHLRGGAETGRRESRGVDRLRGRAQVGIHADGRKPGRGRSAIGDESRRQPAKARHCGKPTARRTPRFCRRAGRLLTAVPRSGNISPRLPLHISRHWQIAA